MKVNTLLSPMSSLMGCSRGSTGAKQCQQACCRKSCLAYQQWLPQTPALFMYMGGFAATA
jgi:hypothetical protein